MMNILLTLLAIAWLSSGIYFYYHVLDPAIREKTGFAVFIVFLILTPPIVLRRFLLNLTRNS